MTASGDAPGSSTPPPAPPAPSGYAPYQPSVGMYAAPVAPTHPLAITALVLGSISIASVVLALFVGITIVGVLCAPFAVWLGRRARREIRTSPERYSGDGIALAGFITGIVGCVLGLLAVLAVVAVIGFFVWLFSSYDGGLEGATTIDAIRLLR